MHCLFMSLFTRKDGDFDRDSKKELGTLVTAFRKSSTQKRRIVEVEILSSILIT